MTMDYLTAAEGLAILAYLYYLSGELRKLAESRPFTSSPYAVGEIPQVVDERPKVKIVRVTGEGKYTTLAEVSPSHETVGLALATEGLAVLHEDGRLQKTAGDK